MFAFTRSDVQRIAVSAAGALFFSAVCIGGAIAPAQAGATTPSATTAWERDTANRIDDTITAPAALLDAALRNAQIGVMVAPDGTVSAPTLLQSSGSRRLDRMLMRNAGTMKLAPLPGTETRPVVLRVPLRNNSQWATVTWPTATRYAAK